MKESVKIAAILLVILNASLLVPAAAPYFDYLAITAAVVALALAVAAFAPAPKSVPKPAVAEAVKPPAAAAVPQNQARAEVVTLLGVFQEKGRLIDFLMEDVTPYSDQEVGSVARSVHQGCKAALNEHFSIEPVSTEAEGAAVTVPAGYPADEFRFVGNLSGQAPFTGKLVHKGWRVNSVKLPRVLNLEGDRLPALAPAQVEVS
jgi:hypothetical protein